MKHKKHRARARTFYAPDARWTAWGVKSDLHRLFCLLWEEMLSDTTLDSWQVRTCNVPTLLAELEQVSTIAQRSDRYKPHIPPLREELMSALSGDEVAKARVAFLEKELTNDNPQEIARITAVARAHLDDYGSALASRLRNELAGDDTKKKQDLADLALLFATNLATQPHSLPHLQDAATALRDAKTPDFVDRYDAFVGACTSVDRAFTCIFSVDKWPTLNAKATPLAGIAVSQGPPSGKLKGERKAFYNQVGPTDVVVEIPVRAPHPHAARGIAEKRLRDAFAAITLFHPQTRVALKNVEALIVDDGGSASIRPPDKSRLGHIRDLSQIGALLEQVAAVTGKLDPVNARRFRASMEYHQIAVAATTDDVRLVNLWTALECLVGGHGAAFDRLSSWLPYALGLRNARKTLRGIGRYVREAWHKQSASLLPMFPNSSASSLDEGDLFDVLIRDEGDPHLELLFKTITHVLIRWRLTKVRSRMRKMEEVIGLAKRHARNVEWQLRRVYRARNQIAHQGEPPDNVRHLVQHLHTYYVLAVRTLLDDVLAFSYSTLDACFEHRRVMWACFVGAKDATGDAHRRWVLEPHAFFKPRS
jgi:hypothetical protein